LPDATPGFEPAATAASDIAFLQYTSGSTGDPKGVAVSHGAVAANCRGIAAALELDAERDVALSWLPLYHDMGLVGFVMTPLFSGVSSVLMPTSSFLRRPLSWLETIERHRATITFCPPFALALAMKQHERRPTHARLESLRVLGIGAEPISADLVRAFHAAFAAQGLSPGSLTTAYGMAEATVAVSIKRHPDGLQPAERPSCGAALPGHELAIRDPEDGHALAAGEPGEIWFRGPSLGSGYYLNERASREVFENGWLRTGDLGCIVGGELFVTGRLKDLVIVNGRNYEPQAFEWSVAELPGVRAGHVVACSRPGWQSEELVVLLEAAGADDAELGQQVCRRIAERHGLQVAEVRVLPPGTLPKTSSGKLRRRLARERYAMRTTDEAS
jgi:fatty-acyl-CoA synthase